MAIVHEVVSRHVEDAAFLWLNRAGAVTQPHYTLKTLATLDGRLEAHLDGLRVAGDTGWEIIVEELGWKEAGEFFTAAFLAIEHADRSRWDLVAEKLLTADEGAAGVVSALGWNEYDHVRPLIRSLLESDSPIHRRVGIAAASIHRRDPEGMLPAGANDPDSQLRARTMKAIGELGRSDLMSLVLQCFSDEDLAVQFAAAGTAAMLGHGPAATTLLQQLAEAHLSRSESAAFVASRTMDPFDANTWQNQLSDESNKRLPIIIAGATGDPIHLPWLIDQLQNEPFARLAGEAFSMITGADLAFLDLDRKPPEEAESGPNDDPNDENVALDSDHFLPWPEPKQVAKWYARNCRELAEGKRYLRGKPIAINTLTDALKKGYQRQRIAASFELAMLQPNKPLFEVRAPATKQTRLLGI